MKPLSALLLAITFAITCCAQFPIPGASTGPPITQIVRRIYEDKKGNLWIGTNSDGVCRYDGKYLTYFSVIRGFSGWAVRGIAEDKDGNVWFGTEGGLSKFDGNHFTNYSTDHGLISNDIWSLLIDKTGTLWVGTLEGVCRYSPGVQPAGVVKFTPFTVPEAKERDFSRGVTSAKVIWDIKEDKDGNIWFGTNGGGAYRYNGKSLVNISKSDGLAGNSVNNILQDRKGNLWFATQRNGVTRYDGKTYTTFTTANGLCGDEAWKLYEDSKGNIWCSVRGGVCRYDGRSFTSFAAPNCCVQAMLEDRAGRFWFGAGDGLFRFDGSSFLKVGKDGPWQ